MPDTFPDLCPDCGDLAEWGHCDCDHAGLRVQKTLAALRAELRAVINNAGGHAAEDVSDDFLCHAAAEVEGCIGNLHATIMDAAQIIVRNTEAHQKRIKEFTEKIEELEAEVAGLREDQNTALRQAFIDGARWWEYKSTGFTMW